MYYYFLSEKEMNKILLEIYHVQAPAKKIGIAFACPFTSLILIRFFNQYNEKFMHFASGICPAVQSLGYGPKR